MKKMCCALIAASCLAQSVDAMQQPQAPAAQQPANAQQVVAAAPVVPQNNQQAPGQPQVPAAQPQQVQGAPANQQNQVPAQPQVPANVPQPAAPPAAVQQNNPQVLAPVVQSQAPVVQQPANAPQPVAAVSIERKICELCAKLDLTNRKEIMHNVIGGSLAFFALCSCPRIIKSVITASSPAVMAVAAYKSPTFREILKSCWIAPLTGMFLDLGINGLGYDEVCALSILGIAGLGYAGMKGYSQWVDIEKWFDVYIKAIHDTFSWINENPKKIFASLITVLALICFLRNFELISDDIFASFALPSAGAASLLWFLKIRDAKPEKKSSEKKSEPSKEKFVPLKK